VLDSVRNLLQQGDNAILLSLLFCALVLLLLIAWVGMAWRMRRFKRQLTALTRGMNEHNLEEVLVGHLDKVDQTERRMDTMEQAVAVLQAQIPNCVQRVHLVRYDAFDDVGGEQSFSMALLDAFGNGVVLTSVYSRLDIRVYAKAIREGRASHALSEEENRVLRETTAR
jgi:hypothetical protein